MFVHTSVVGTLSFTLLNDFTSAPPEPLSKVNVPPLSGMNWGNAVGPCPPPNCAAYTPPVANFVSCFVPFGPATLIAGPASRIVG
jgi:hypothetical protein